MQWKSMWILWNLYCSAFQQPSIHLQLQERLHRIAVSNRYPGVSRLYLQLIKIKIICWLRLISLLNLHSYALDSFQVRVYQIHVQLDILVLIRQRRSVATIIDAQVLSTGLFVLCPFFKTFTIFVVSLLPRRYYLEHTVHKVQKVTEALLLQQYCCRWQFL